MVCFEVSRASRRGSSAKKRAKKINLLADQRELLRFVPYQELLQSLGGGNAYRFALGDVKGIPKEWADYHASSSRSSSSSLRGAQPQRRRCRLHLDGSLVAQAPPARPARRRRAAGRQARLRCDRRPDSTARLARRRPGPSGAPPPPGAVRGASWSTASGRARAASAAVRRRDARLRRRRRGHAARRAARAGADGG